jgi:hypothetical protein
VVPDVTSTRKKQNTATNSRAPSPARRRRESREIRGVKT